MADIDIGNFRTFMHIGHPKHLDEISTHPDWHIRSQLIYHDPSFHEKLSNDHDPRVRKTVARNTKSKKLLDKLLKDRDEDVASLAAKSHQWRTKNLDYTD